MDHIKQFPHCDPRILHAPGKCVFCDAHPDWQELREFWAINFTGEHDAKKSSCPAELARPFEILNAWGGNRAKTDADLKRDEEAWKKTEKKIFEELDMKPRHVSAATPVEAQEILAKPDATDEELRRAFAMEEIKADPDHDPYKTTLSGKAPDPNYDGPAPQPINEVTGQHADHWILSDEERKKGFIRPVRDSYRHKVCGQVTTMPRKIAETYARNPGFYGATFCCTCGEYLPVGEHGEFIWLDDGTKVGT